jgi:c-di-GMP-binding flagellar brake protein YcgR
MRFTSLFPRRSQPAPAVPQAHDDFRISDDFEIASLLQQVVEARVPVNLSTPDGLSCTTELVGVNAVARRISFAATTRDMRLRTLVDVDETMAVAYLQQVRLQFDLNGLVMVHGHKDSVLQAEWPRAVYRFQRRQSYRVRPLEHQKPVAHLQHPVAPHEAQSVRVKDVSLGGLALQFSGDDRVIPPGTRLDHVQVELDALTRLDAALRIVHVSVQDVGNGGTPSTRLGCEWIRLGGDGQRVLQRYIEQTQKRQRLVTLAGKG